MSSKRYEEVAALVKEITYKPGWAFMVDDIGLAIEITAHYYTPDTWSVEPRQAMVYARLALYDSVPLEIIPTWVFRELICRLEQHEAAEHFRWRGEWVQPPHPKPGESWPF